MTPAQRRKLDQGTPLVDGIVGKQEAALLRNYRESYDDIRRRLEALYVKYTSGEVLGKSTWTQGRRLLDMAEQVGRELERLTGQAATGLDAALVETFKGGAGLAQFVLESGAGVVLDMGTINTDVIRAAIGHKIDGIKWPQRMNVAQARAYQNAQALLNRGLTEGWSYQRMARELGKILDSSYAQNVRIMRTEAHRVQNEGRQATWDRAKKAGVKLRRIWVATLDPRTRDSHQAMDGQLEDAEGQFISGEGHRAKLPGGFGIPDEDINCRCTTAAQVYGLSPSVRFARDADGQSITVPGRMTYDEWSSTYHPDVKPSSSGGSSALGNLGGVSSRTPPAASGAPANPLAVAPKKWVVTEGAGYMTSFDTKAQAHDFAMAQRREGRNVYFHNVDTYTKFIEPQARREGLPTPK